MPLDQQKQPPRIRSNQLDNQNNKKTPLIREEFNKNVIN